MPIILALVITLCGCVRSTKPEFTQEIEQRGANFDLYVANQSSEKPKVDIAIIIDGESLVNDTFRVENQHYWKIYSLNLPVGEHQMRVIADNGNYNLEKAFNITKKHWAVISFWYTNKKGKNYHPSGISFEISDEPYSFL